MYDPIFLGEIRDLAVELYQNSGIMPPDNLKQALKAKGVPEEKWWETRNAIRTLGLVEKHTKSREKKVPVKNWFGNVPLPAVDNKSRAAGE